MLPGQLCLDTWQPYSVRSKFDRFAKLVTEVRSIIKNQFPTPQCPHVRGLKWTPNHYWIDITLRAVKSLLYESLELHVYYHAR